MIKNQLFPAREPTQVCDATKATCRILVVDDDGDWRHLIGRALVRVGYAVEAAENGTVAWNSLQVNSYDLMVTDNDMPGFTGVELLGKLRDAHMDLPVIMVTSVIPDQEFAKRPLLVPDAILRKPFVMAELLEKVQAVLAESLECAAMAAESDYGSSFYNRN